MKTFEDWWKENCWRYDLLHREQCKLAAKEAWEAGINEFTRTL